jgi:hypothetical protein
MEEPANAQGSAEAHAEGNAEGSGEGAPPAPLAGARPLSLGGVLDAAFDLVRRHPAVLVGPAAVAYLGLALVGVPLGGSDAGAGAPPPSAGLAARLAPLIAVTLLVTTVVAAAATDASVRLLRGARIGVVEAVRGGLRVVVPLFATLLLASAVVLFAALPLIGVIALWDQVGDAAGTLLALAAVVLLLVVAARFLLLSPLVVAERAFGTAALRRSVELMEGQVLRVCAVIGFATLLAAMLDVAVDTAAETLGPAGPFLAAGFQALVFAYSTAVSVVLYFDVRLRRGEDPSGGACGSGPEGAHPS